MMADTGVLNLPASSREKLAEAARRWGVSADELAARAIEEHLQAAETFDLFERAKLEVDWAWFDRFMSRDGGAPPRPGDEVA